MKTRSLLVVHSGYPEAMNFFMPDNGLASLAGCLVDAGHQTEILDFNTPHTMRQLIRRDRPKGVADLVRQRRFEAVRSILAQDEEHHGRVFAVTAERVAHRVRSEGIDWVGFKLWSGDSLAASHAMASRIKAECPRTVILAGGPQADRVGEEILREFPSFDMAAVGEGEPSVVAFAECVGRGLGFDDVPNLLLRDGDRIIRTRRERVRKLNALPEPCYDEAVYPGIASQKLRVLSFEESRGCTNRCTFCTHRNKVGTLRVRSPTGAVGQLKRQLKQSGCVAFRLSGSYTPAAALQQWATELPLQGVEYPWTAFGHVRDSSLVDYSTVRAAGCVAMLFGIESGSQRILDDVIDKGVTVEDARRTLLAAERAGVSAIASLIYPNHSESEESRRETLALLDETKPFGASILFPGLFPGSRWWEEPTRYGFGVADRATYLRSLLAFKVRLFYPVELWDLLDVALDGKSQQQVLRECLDFTASVRDLGIHCPMADETLLFAEITGADPLALRDRTVHAFVAGDVDEVEALMGEVHRAGLGRLRQGGQ